MSSPRPRKANKLSLKRKPAKDTAGTKSIVSLFKAQKAGKSEHESIIVADSSSEADAIIAEPPRMSVESHTIKHDTHIVESKQKSIRNTDISTAFGEKGMEEFKQVRGKRKKTDHSAADGDNSGKSKSADDSSKSARKTSKLCLEASTKRPYSLRKRHTVVPIIDISESDEESTCCSRNEQNNASKRDNDSERSVIEDETSSKYFSRANKRKRSGKEPATSRLSLKKAKTVGHGIRPEKVNKFNKTSTCEVIDVETYVSEKGKGVGSVKITPRVKSDACTRSSTVTVNGNTETSVNSREDAPESSEAGSAIKSAVKPYKGNFLAKMKEDLEKKQEQIDTATSKLSRHSKLANKKGSKGKQTEVKSALTKDTPNDSANNKGSKGQQTEVKETESAMPKHKPSDSVRASVKQVKSIAESRKTKRGKLVKHEHEPDNIAQKGDNNDSIDDSDNSETCDEILDKLDEKASEILGKLDEEASEIVGKLDEKASEIVGKLDEKASESHDTEQLEQPASKAEYRIPYYLENFNTVLANVLEDKDYVKLFDKSDMAYVDKFKVLEESRQKLFVRIFSRKLSWLTMSKLSYPEISDDIPQLVDDLIDAGLVLSGDELDELAVVLKILSAPDLKSLAKSFHMNCAGLTKPKLLEMLVKKGEQNSISAMFKGGAAGNMRSTILNRARPYVGKVCRLNEEARTVFMRVLMLFSVYHTNVDEENGGGGQNQLFQMLLVNIGRLTYPGYTVNRETPVFVDRGALNRYSTALQFELDLQALTENNKWTAALDVYEKAKAVGTTVATDQELLRWDKKLPQFLREYTAGSVYTRIDNQAVEILQRLKQYTEAVALLEQLLSQHVYCQNYRGHWYERLALNLEAHLKSPAKSLAVIKRGLADKTVRKARRYAIYERARKLCEAPKSRYADKMKEYEHEAVSPTPEVWIDGMVISDATSMGMKYQFILQGDTDSVTLCAVEELVLEHYKHNGFPEGLHAEGSIISNLFVLLCWDILFMDVADVFQGPFQSCPLDMATQEFYISRRDVVDARLKWLSEATEQDLMDEVAKTWTDHSGTMCAGINWDKFAGPETHQHLLSCMGGEIIAGILERYVKDPRHTRSGFPDLTLWNYETKKFKICEVKGPNDRLSYKQILWIDYLLKLGVDAEACYVKAVGSKRLKPQTSSQQ